MVRYYGYYSNVCRGRRKKEDQDGLIPYLIEQEEDSKEYRKHWARLIRKIHPAHLESCFDSDATALLCPLLTCSIASRLQG